MKRTRFSEFPRRSGIYMIQSIVNDKRYIGSAVNLKNRKGSHMRSFKNNCNSSYMQNHANKHGIDVLKFLVLEFCLKEELIKREQYWIDTLNPEFNLCPTAGSMLGFRFSEKSKRKMRENHTDYSGENHPRFGKKHSKESKQKNSETKKAYYQTPEGKEVSRKHSEFMKGKIPWCEGLTKETDPRLKKMGEKISKNEERNRKISIANKGKSVSEETKQKNRESQIKRMANPELRQKNREASLKQWEDLEWKKNHIGENHPMFGKTHSEEIKKKQSESHKGQIAWNKSLTKETDLRVKQISKSLKGEKNYMFGKHHSEETKQKMSDARKKWCQENKQKVIN